MHSRLRCSSGRAHILARFLGNFQAGTLVAYILSMYSGESPVVLLCAALGGLLPHCLRYATVRQVQCRTSSPLPNDSRDSFVLVAGIVWGWACVPVMAVGLEGSCWFIAPQPTVWDWHVNSRMHRVMLCLASAPILQKRF